MCELTAVNLGKRKINITAVQLLAWQGSRANRDGFGYMCSGNWAKTALAPHETIDFGEFIGDRVKSNNPILAHIRSASGGVPVTSKNSHPFESKHFVLFHNGTLTRAGEKRRYAGWWNDPKNKNEKPPESDSLIFLRALEKEYEKDKNFVDAFNAAMKGFWGKFAFLIYEKKTRNIIVVRGRTAPLHISYLLDEEGKKIGWMVNTAKDNLEKVALQISCLSQTWEKESLTFSDPEVIEVNSIHVFNGNELEKIGDCHENEEKDVAPKEEEKKKENTSIVQRITNGARHLVAATRTDYSVAVDDALDKNDPIADMARFMLDHKMMPKDMMLLFKLTCGMELVQATSSTIRAFVEEALPRFSAYPSFRKGVDNRVSGHVFPAMLYTAKYKLEFPWPINNEQKVFKAMKEFYAEHRRD